MKKLLARLALLVVFFLLALAAWVAAALLWPIPRRPGMPPKQPGVAITIAKETTYITEPLRPDGYVDYVAALNQRCSQGVTPENNAAVLFWQAMGPAEISKESRQQYFKMLGMEPLPEGGTYFFALATYVERQRKSSGKPTVALEDDEKLNAADRQYSVALQRPWSGSEFPVLAAWLAANEKPLTLLIAASKRPRRYDPLISRSLLTAPYPGLFAYRDAARALMVRATLRMNEARLDEARDDLLACHRLSRLAAQGPTITDALVGISLDGFACGADQVLLQHLRLTAAQALKMRDDLAKLPPISQVADALDTAERFAMLDAVAELARGSAGSFQSVLEVWFPPKDYLAIWGAMFVVDFDDVLRTVNTYFDQVSRACRMPPGGDRCRAVSNVPVDYKSAAISRGKQSILSALWSPRNCAAQWIGDYVVLVLCPGAANAVQAVDRNAMQLELVKLGFSLAAYRADRGEYPATLADLMPKYAAMIPGDIFADAPLHYVRKVDGYLLYSAGPNGKDDGGNTYLDREKAEDRDWDDLVVRVPAPPIVKKEP